LRVLIAEDLALLRDGLTRLLRDHGIEVVAAARRTATPWWRPSWRNGRTSP
jgi:DNA-binding NarL/FixJ family response regulator